MAAYVDSENAVKAWLSTREAVASQVRRPDGGLSIFLAMPAASPLPSLVLSRVGGAPTRSTTPVDLPRVSIDCWAASRPTAIALARSVATELDNLAATGGAVTPHGRLHAAEIVGWVWLPDRESDTPRYVIDALIVIHAG